jgi:hypothetical protein
MIAIRDNDVSKIIDVSKESGSLTENIYDEKYEL